MSDDEDFEESASDGDFSVSEEEWKPGKGDDSSSVSESEETPGEDSFAENIQRFGITTKQIQLVQLITVLSVHFL